MSTSKSRNGNQNMNSDFPVKFAINNYLATSQRDKISRCQALYGIFKDVFQEMRHQKNSPRDIVDDIKFIIDDYFENEMINIIHD